MPEREVTVYRFEQLWREGDRAAFAIECSSGTYVRSLIADLGDAYCVELRRTRSAPSTSRTPTRTRVAAARRRAGLPADASTLDADAAWRAAPRRRRVARRGRRGEHVLLVDADGPVAIAEPREDGVLKPVVGFRG